MRLYLDAAPVIYAVEQVAPFFPVVDARLSTSGTVRVASDLTRMECRVKPVREGNADLLKDYDDFFAYAAVEIVALSREVMDQATEIRAIWVQNTGCPAPCCCCRDQLRRVLDQRPSARPLS